MKPTAFPSGLHKHCVETFFSLADSNPSIKNSHAVAAQKEDHPAAPPNKRARAAICYMMAREEVEPCWYPRQENMVTTDVLQG
eukprot:7376374-Prorocentrum_lima.AAC.1